jgi:hypothetical protein
MFSAMWKYLRDAFSDNGQPSASRLLMGIFSLFTITILYKTFSHLVKLSEASNGVILTIWLSNLPLIITSLCALIALPYTVSRGASALTDLAQLAASFRKKE